MPVQKETLGQVDANCVRDGGHFVDVHARSHFSCVMDDKRAFTFDTTSVEIYDPSTGIWTVTNSLNTVRYDHTATLLPDGRVFVAGGTGGTNISNIARLSSAELFNAQRTNNAKRFYRLYTP